MKPAPFEYHAPETAVEAASLLQEAGGDGKVLAGGQSLLPLMNLRLARPSVLVDLGRVQGLDGTLANGGIRIGSMVRHGHVQRSHEIQSRVPMLTEAMRHVGHPAIRNRGTLGGSLAHADPAAEAPLVAVALGAELVALGAGGTRTIPADEFFQGPFMTALADDELLTEILFPEAPASAGWGFREVARAHGDFALVAVAAVVSVEDGRLRDARIAVAGAADRPTRIAAAEQALEGAAWDAAARSDVEQIVRDALSPAGDSHASAEYRKSVAGVLAARALDDATKATGSTA
ncbi:MAG: aerobic carbon-monoxide dehydrogenase medium subunit [Thermoleophilaceae bacterium]|jgi:carbon-monoxide dehydrogenase medium subunit|nr:aerobic carbon-monoxide dehydrogenase medium subunit [Thermoleophilaceae bacterium]MEA2406707.1 aerobic carbon-monoxide dehydrogenase medium subunit [Thermoleophilaceae bacterium]